MRSRNLLMVCVSSILAGVSCAGTPTPASQLVELPTRDEARKSSCKVTRTQNRPFIVEWSGSQRTDLEAHLRSAGLVAVRYHGCELEVLAQCKIGGAYRWVRTTREREELVMSDTDALYAQLPFIPSSVEAHLTRGRSLKITSTISGKYVADRPSIGLADLEKMGGECATATHLVVGVTAGAYEFASQANASVGASAGSLVGGESSARRELLRRSGDDKACSSAKNGDAAPPDDCGAMLRLELAEVKCPISMKFVPDRGCVARASAPATVRPEVASTDARHAEIVAFVREVSKVTLAALRGEPFDENWNSQGLRDSLADAQAKLQGASVEPDVVMLGFKTEIITRVDDAKVYRNDVSLLVKHDGSVRWLPPRGQFVRVNPGSYSLSPYAVIESAMAPAAIVREVDRFKADFKPTECRLRTVREEDSDALPLAASEREALKKELLGLEGTLQTTCQELAQAKGKTSVDPRKTEVVTLLVASSGLWDAVASLDWSSAGKPHISQIRVHEP